ncbi:hypothetical protein [Kineococcus aurantiacus]|uniref:Uncharacterized protein n=1 Tax=Kineococcus aurantiacus TaxID=37633 RepID=A0A7Y9DM18_9ACTN|nr:hypothetical protein [Kineococcus aurantiacus]NYD23110.1 hypothetical protein [Kineococcus aurantiacus]
MELAVGSFLVGFPGAGSNVFGQEELDLVERWSSSTSLVGETAGRMRAGPRRSERR